MPENIVSYTSKELAAMEAQGESRTDWQRVKAMTDAEIEAAIAADPDAEEITDEEWQRVTLTIPVQLDAEMMAWLQAQGEDCQKPTSSAWYARRCSKSTRAAAIERMLCLLMNPTP
ncbi:hypothetical protein [Chroococcidiopsis sp. CCMEE 29]|uniref:hypothetical protein n=1 Tax=Chroococcidiopsis sp. CCMEE 29 TaxID=155894 RepID=UPI0020222B45|nr:hypothetical protein [Chroococcidiopsis sp. CCMEE 29]